MRLLLRAALPAIIGATGAVAAVVGGVGEGKILDRVQAHSDYLENCSGCHGHDGNSAPAELPVLRGRVGYFLCTPEARAYLIRLPNVANSRITDDAELADMLNYVVFELGGASAPPKAPRFSAEEVTRERRRVLNDVSLKAVRANLVRDVIRACNAPASLKLLYPDAAPN